MVKFGLGVVVGALLMAAFASTHPDQTKSALRSGADHISSGVSAAATSAQNAADKQFGK